MYTASSTGMILSAADDTAADKRTASHSADAPVSITAAAEAAENLIPAALMPIAAANISADVAAASRIISVMVAHSVSLT